MKRPLLFLSLFTVFALAVVSSCKKEKKQTPFTRVQGKWRKMKYATDDNRNGVIDTREIRLTESSIVNTIEFKGDSTGIEKTSSSPDLNFRWQIIGTASILIQYNSNDTFIYSVQNITSEDMTITTDSKLGLLWYYYVRN